MAEQTLELPLDVIKASPGFSLDIGGSIAKVVYRSKEDFENAEPKDKELDNNCYVDKLASMDGVTIAQAMTGKGLVRHKLITSEKIDDLLDFIKENCDLTMADNGETVIHSTGLGGNSQKTKIEEALNGKMKNLSESDLFVDAASLFLRTKSAKDVFKPVNEKGLKSGMILVETFRGWDDANDKSSKLRTIVKGEIDDYDPERDTQRFPCLLVVCGSACWVVKIDEDGTCKFLETITVGGRFFMGGVSFLTGITDFAEISKLIGESDGKTVDHFVSDLVDSSVEGDVYSAINKDWRPFPFGKGLTDEKDHAKKGDLIHSLLESVCENLGMVVTRIALHDKAPRVYFCGNFVETPKAQEFITSAMHGRRYLVDEPLHFEFLQHGGVLGALGAFIKAYELQTAQQKVE